MMTPDTMRSRIEKLRALAECPSSSPNERNIARGEIARLQSLSPRPGVMAVVRTALSAVL